MMDLEKAVGKDGLVSASHCIFAFIAYSDALSNGFLLSTALASSLRLVQKQCKYV